MKVKTLEAILAKGRRKRRRRRKNERVPFAILSTGGSTTAGPILG